MVGAVKKRLRVGFGREQPAPRFHLQRTQARNDGGERGAVCVCQVQQQGHDAVGDEVRVGWVEVGQKRLLHRMGEGMGNPDKRVVVVFDQPVSVCLDFNVPRAPVRGVGVHGHSL